MELRPRNIWRQSGPQAIGETAQHIPMGICRTSPRDPTSQTIENHNNFIESRPDTSTGSLGIGQTVEAATFEGASPTTNEPPLTLKATPNQTYNCLCLDHRLVTDRNTSCNHRDPTYSESEPR